MEMSDPLSVMRYSGASTHVKDVSFVDDVSIPVLAPSNQICHKVSSIANCAYSVFISYGMRLNFNAGKSEATIGFYGAGSKNARKALLAKGNVLQIEAGDFKELRIVPVYQHVGTLSPRSCNINDEVVTRVCIMRNDSQHLCKHILRVKSIPVVKKVCVIQAYIISKGIFQSGTWPNLNDTQYRRFHGCILKLYRDATGQYYKHSRGDEDNGSTSEFNVCNMFNDDDLVYQFGFMCPKTMLRFARLSLFLRILRKSPPQIKELILAQDERKFKSGWVQSLRSDIVWLSQAEFFDACQGYDLAAWIGFVSGNLKTAVSKVRVFCKSPYANIVTQWATSPSLKALSSPIECEQCGQILKSLQSHALHMSSKHGVKNKFRKYVDGPICRVCLVNFWSRERCLNHVRYRSPVCRANNIWRGPVLSDEEANSLDQSECTENKRLYAAGKRRHQAALPCIRVCGPLLPILTEHSSAHHPLGRGHNYR